MTHLVSAAVASPIGGVMCREPANQTSLGPITRCVTPGLREEPAKGDQTSDERQQKKTAQDYVPHISQGLLSARPTRR
jgi:hypothetical protein